MSLEPRVRIAKKVINRYKVTKNESQRNANVSITMQAVSPGPMFNSYGRDPGTDSAVVAGKGYLDPNTLDRTMEVKGGR